MKAKEDSCGQGSQPQEETLRLRWRHQWFDPLTLSRGKSGIGLPRWLSGKESACQAGDADLIPVLGRSSGEGNGNSLQYSCLGNHIYRGAWRVGPWGCKRTGDDLAITQQHNNNNKLQFVFLFNHWRIFGLVIALSISIDLIWILVFRLLHKHTFLFL